MSSFNIFLLIQLWFNFDLKSWGVPNHTKSRIPTCLSKNYSYHKSSFLRFTPKSAQSLLPCDSLSLLLIDTKLKLYMAALNLKLLQHDKFCLHLSNTGDENQGHFKQRWYYLLNHSLIKKKKKTPWRLLISCAWQCCMYFWHH